MTHLMLSNFLSASILMITLVALLITVASDDWSHEIRDTRWDEMRYETRWDTREIWERYERYIRDIWEIYMRYIWDIWDIWDRDWDWDWDEMRWDEMRWDVRRWLGIETQHWLLRQKPMLEAVSRDIMPYMILYSAERRPQMNSAYTVAGESFVTFTLKKVY